MVHTVMATIWLKVSTCKCSLLSFPFPSHESAGVSCRPASSSRKVWSQRFYSILCQNVTYCVTEIDLLQWFSKTSYRSRHNCSIPSAFQMQWGGRTCNAINLQGGIAPHWGSRNDCRCNIKCWQQSEHETTDHTPVSLSTIILTTV